MQSLRPEHDINAGRPLNDRCALLAGDTTANADDHLWPLLLEFPPASEQGKNFLGSLLANRTGIQEQDVGFPGLSARMAPSADRNTSSILDESYSFIWQPNVLIYTLLDIIL